VFDREAPLMTARLPVPNSLISKMDFALEARRRGLRVYPMAENSEEAALPEGDCFATTVESQIREWWHDDPTRNVGLSAEDALIIRITERCPQHKVHEFAALLKANAVPLTCRTVRNELDTPRLEICFFYKLPIGATVAGGEDVFGRGIDVLSTDGVVLGPGSTLPQPGKCEFHGDSAMADANPWLMKMCGVQLPESNSMTNVVPMKKPVLASAASGSAAPTTIPVKTKMDWALEAAEYIPVHPLRWYIDPGPHASQQKRDAAVTAAKAPLLNDWQNLATQDPQQIRKWFDHWPDANIGGATNDFIVVDVDPRNGGDDTFAGLIAAEYNFPETATTRTQGGGRHLIYVSPVGPLKGGNHKLGDGVDVKAGGGNLVMPGSTIEGRMYTRENARPPAFAPQWVIDQLGAAKPKPDAAGKRIIEEDDLSVEMAERWLNDHAPRAEMGNRDNTAYRVGAKFGDFGCGYTTRLDLLLRWNDTHCDPPLDVEDLERIAQSAGSSRENAIGNAHPLAPGFEPVEIDESNAPKSAARISTSDLIQTSAQFVQGFVPPEYLVDQVLQRRFCYSITAQTGVGKTAVAMLLSAHVGAGRSLGNLDVEKGSVLYFAGENPTDIQMRWLGITRELNIDPATADMHFVPGAMPLSQAASRITEEVTRKGLRPALVVVDTAAAYFEGDDENSNTQAVAHARRLRALTELPGGPCVLILCHPTKRAADDDLIPRGGGAFLAEVDGNIALQKRESLIVASSLGKFRGRDFAPLSFELKTVQHPVLKDARGRSIPTVVARHLGEVEKQRISADTLGRENQLLAAVQARPDASLRELAELLGWRFKTGQPDQSKVSRALDALAKAKLVRKQGRHWEVTPTGLAELERSTRPTECPETDENHCSNAATDEADIRSKNETPTRATKRVLQSATK
jgi:hypothetical protein